ncbi:hypothetical protein E1B28_002621 [Marasmius oreades]|uniref:Uncharacterized protein n=1 Tax=Marasmius oreades TaxID=181124 RepID=A0A9P7RPG7_9AGAR|nr:uncharacterized protein E1B28_002621 [Marasmius oreades]KAG7086683.1 hypothetical protein E1B28_002621 [Marasmius oreades]
MYSTDTSNAYELLPQVSMGSEEQRLNPDQEQEGDRAAQYIALGSSGVHSILD